MERAGAQGAVSTVNAASASFLLTPTWTEHFQPSGATVTVQTNANMVFTRGIMMGAAAGFSDLVVGSVVMVSGTYDPATGILTAMRVTNLPKGPFARSRKLKCLHMLPFGRVIT